MFYTHSQKNRNNAKNSQFCISLVQFGLLKIALKVESQLLGVLSDAKTYIRVALELPSVLTKPRSARSDTARPGPDRF